MGEGQEEERLDTGVRKEPEDNELDKATDSSEKERRETQREDSKGESFGVLEECTKTKAEGQRAGTLLGKAEWDRRRRRRQL